MPRLFSPLFIAAFSTPFAAVGATPTYNRDVRPILADNCFACHGADAKHREAGLRLDTQQGARGKGEGGGIAIVPGKPDESGLWQRINSTDPDEVMPPPDTHKTLSARQKETLRKWIEGGAQYEDHWAFIPPQRPALPPGEGNPIDLFIRSRLAEAKLSPSPEADRATLLRRVSLDITGLPPTPEELDAFIADKKPGAYERQVDRLLASPRYGEHMAASWLDLARYSDSNGYLHDVMRTGWPWRDWVIDAFNRNLPFDRFVVEQLAGDLLPGAKPEQTLATAFLRNHPITAEGGTIAAEYLNEYAADRVETVGTVFLGLTFNCCRCHDHKFDPLPQEDFYGMLAFFNSSTERHAENNDAPAYPPLIEIASPLQPDGSRAKVMVMDEAPKPRETFVLKRGQYDQPDKERPATRRPPVVLGPPLGGEPANRLGLAHWIVSAKNPLLARVTVNRLWQRLFGTGLVDSVGDFGLQGEFPSHPELLDYLAVGFGATWDYKRLVRAIVTSHTYRQSSLIRPDLTAADPHNRLLGSFPRRRNSAEQIRDSALLASGLLVEKLGGPPVKPYQPPGLWREKANQPNKPTGHYVRGAGDDLYRRSIYTFHKRTSPPPTMSIFDAPERTSCSARRSPTNTPLQALATMNDEGHLECAKVLALRTLKIAGNSSERLTSMYRRVTGRLPSPGDLVLLSEGLTSFQTRFEASPGDAAALLQQGDFPVGGTPLLASATIPDGSKPDADGYAYVAIKPVTLRANTQYIIGGEDTNAFWDAHTSGARGSAFAANPAASLVASRYIAGFAKPITPGKESPGRWLAGNAKYSPGSGFGQAKATPLFDFDPEKIDAPGDRHGPDGLTIGNLFEVGDRDIQISALGLQDAAGGDFKSGRVGIWRASASGLAPGEGAELAAWMLIASTVLNLDATLVQD